MFLSVFYVNVCVALYEEFHEVGVAIVSGDVDESPTCIVELIVHREVPVEMVLDLLCVTSVS